MPEILNFFKRNKKEEVPKLEAFRSLLQIYHKANELNVDLKDFKPDRLSSYGKQLINNSSYWQDQETKFYVLPDGKRVNSSDFRKVLEDAYDDAALEGMGFGEWFF